MHIGNFSHDHVLNAGMGQHFLRVVCHVGQHHQRLGTGIVELVLHFTGGVQRVGVNNDQASTHGTEDNDRVLGKDRKSTRLNSSHVRISYAVFCLKKKTKKK